MALPKLTYEDYKSRLSIQEVLQEAGYHLNRKDGLRYPSYVRLGSDGRRVSGDKFIVCGNGNCCFQPPERKNYNIISFIKCHPHLFADYRVGMSLDRLVNVVCHKLLNQPLEERQTRILDPVKERKPFDIKQYEVSKEPRLIARFMIPRGISKRVQETFAPFMFISAKKREDGSRYHNISFPLTVPGKKEIVGMEERGYPNREGKSAYKGLAAGSDATNGLWIANISDKPLAEVKRIFWFESAYDAMSYYQLNENDVKLQDSVFVSTSGSPSKEQMKGMIAECPTAVHELCFDRDDAGRLFAVNFMLTLNGSDFKTSITEDDNLRVDIDGKEMEFDMTRFDFDKIYRNTAHNLIEGCAPEWLPYYANLDDPNKLFSCLDPELPKEVNPLYFKYEALRDETFCAYYCEEDMQKLRQEEADAWKEYADVVKKAFPVFPLPSGKVVYNPCSENYKDYNEELQGTIQRQKQEAAQKEEQFRGFRR